MPSHGWHERKKQHDFDVCQFLGTVPNRFLDWEVITLFYSALHFLDSFFARAYAIDPIDHMDRKNLVKTYLRIVERNYRLLYHLSRDARYNEVSVGQREITKAKSYYGHVKFRLTPVVCICGHTNLVNKNKCENCGKTL